MEWNKCSEAARRMVNAKLLVYTFAIFCLVFSKDLVCKPGYVHNIDSGKCQDIDECDQTKGSMCSQPGSVCINLFGSYRCANFTCPSGMFRKKDIPCCKDPSCTSLSCKDLPRCTTFNYISIPSNIPITPDQCFSIMKMSWKEDHLLRFWEPELIRVNASSKMKNLAEITDFTVGNHSVGSAYLMLCRSLEGPQDVTLDIRETEYDGEKYLDYLVHRHFIFIHEEDFYSKLWNSGDKTKDDTNYVKKFVEVKPDGSVVSKSNNSIIGCAKGMNYDRRLQVCSDINECKEPGEPLCNGRYKDCVNYPGGYMCHDYSCPKGYLIDRQRRWCRRNLITCPDCDGPKKWVYGTRVLPSNFSLTTTTGTLAFLLIPQKNYPITDHELEFKVLRYDKRVKLAEEGDIRMRVNYKANNARVYLTRSLQGLQVIQIKAKLTQLYPWRIKDSQGWDLLLIVYKLNYEPSEGFSLL